MPLRSYKPTSPGRAETRPTFEEITKTAAQAAHRAASQARRPQQPGQAHRPPPGGATSACTGSSTGSATSPACPRGSPPSSTTRTAGAHRPAPLRGRREALHARCRTASASATPRVRARTWRPAPATRCRCAHPARHAGPQHRAHRGSRRPDRAQRRQQRAADGQGRRLRDAAPALRRSPARAHRVHGHGRPGRATSTTRTRSSARPAEPHLGRRPTVRGSAMTPRDHPHGGGEGKSPTGMPPKTPWGKPAMGLRTRFGRTSPTS